LKTRKAISGYPVKEYMKNYYGFSENILKIFLSLLTDINTRCVLLVNKKTKEFIGRFSFDIKYFLHHRFMYISELIIEEKHRGKKLSRILYDQGIQIVMEMFRFPPYSVFILYPDSERAISFWMKVHGFKWLTKNKVYLHKNIGHPALMAHIKHIEAEKLKKDDLFSWA
jgi:ribosomal protein S18 acetylase RimI-like enzyme